MTHPSRSGGPDDGEGIRALAARSLRALVISDQELWTQALDSVLRSRGYTVLRATGGAALEQVDRERPDVLVIYGPLHDPSALSLCQQLRESERVDAATPVIMITADPCTREARLRALRAGAWECFGLPLDGELLFLKLDAYGRWKLDADRLRAESPLDEPTGVYSVTGLVRRALDLGREARRGEWSLGCAVVSLELAEECGEARHHEVMRAAARVLLCATRACDVVGRLDRARLAVLAPETDGEGIARLAEQLAARVESAATGYSLRVRSGCCAAHRTASGLDPVDLIVRAMRTLDGTPEPLHTPPQRS